MVLGVNNFIVLFVADSCIFTSSMFVGDGSMFERRIFVFSSSFTSKKFCTENSELSPKSGKTQKDRGGFRGHLCPRLPYTTTPLPPPPSPTEPSIPGYNIKIKIIGRNLNQ